MGQIHFYAKKGDKEAVISFRTLSWNHGVSTSLSKRQLREEDYEEWEKANHQDLSVTKYSDRHTPGLYHHCAALTEFELVELVWKDKLDYDYVDENVPKGDVIFTMTNVHVAYMTVSGAEGGKPTESVSLCYETLEVKHKDESGKEVSEKVNVYL